MSHHFLSIILNSPLKGMSILVISLVSSLLHFFNSCISIAIILVWLEQHLMLMRKRQSLSSTLMSSFVKSEYFYSFWYLCIHAYLFRNHLTTILPTFRLASAGSDEDMLSSNEEGISHEINTGSDECLSSPLANTVPSNFSPPFQPTNVKTNVSFINRHHMESLPDSTNAEGSSGLNSSFNTKPRVTLQQKSKYLNLTVCFACRFVCHSFNVFVCVCFFQEEN